MIIFFMKCLKADDNELFTPIVKYSKNDFSIIAIGVLHIGEVDYYEYLQQLIDTLPFGFYEFIKPISENAELPEDKEEFRDLFDLSRSYYSSIAERINMVAQKDRLFYLKDWQNSHMTLDEFLIAAPLKGLIKFSGNLAKLDALCELAEEFPKEVSRIIKGGMMKRAKIPFYENFSTGGFGRKMYDVLVVQRNKKLFDALEPRLNDSGEIGLVYGAYYLHGLDKFLRSSGFKKEGTEWVPAWEINEGMTYQQAVSTINRGYK